MADITVTSAQVKALQDNGALVRPYTAGGAITIGYAVYIAADGDVEHADGSAVGTAGAIGIAVESYDGETSVAAGDPVSVCVFGPVSGFSSATPGGKAWVSDTAGRVASSAGDATIDHELGYFESASVLFVMPDPAGAGS